MNDLLPLSKLIQHLIHLKPIEAKDRILAALRAANMNQIHAANEIGVTNGTLSRWIARLGMQEQVRAERAIARAEGRHTTACVGWPAGRKRPGEWTEERRVRASEKMKATLRAKKRRGSRLARAKRARTSEKER